VVVSAFASVISGNLRGQIDEVQAKPGVFIVQKPNLTSEESSEPHFHSEKARSMCVGTEEEL
jgi:hypothetical protein